LYKPTPEAAGVVIGFAAAVAGLAAADAAAGVAGVVGCCARAKATAHKIIIMIKTFFSMVHCKKIMDFVAAEQGELLRASGDREEDSAPKRNRRLINTLIICIMQSTRTHLSESPVWHPAATVMCIRCVSSFSCQYMRA
jgi:hypothetical protein